MLGHTLTVNIAFTSLSLYQYIKNRFNILRQPINMLPSAINSLIDANISIKRIQNFLLADEIIPTTEIPNRRCQINIERGYFSWPVVKHDIKDEIEFKSCLTDINFNSIDSELVAIVGPVGSGKTSFLNSILGEIYRISGDINYSGSVSYVPQTPFIQNATLKDNILFGKTYDEYKYNVNSLNIKKKIINYCSLNQDLQILPAGDLTEIGEKGINLSGGQRSRVALARAAYNDSDM